MVLLYVVSVGLSHECTVRLSGASGGMAGSLSLHGLSLYGVSLSRRPVQACLKGGSISGGQDLSSKPRLESHTMPLWSKQVSGPAQIQGIWKEWLYQVCQRNFPACIQWKTAMYDGKSPSYGHKNLCSEFSSATYHGFVILLLNYLTSLNKSFFLCRVEIIHPCMI